MSMPLVTLSDRARDRNKDKADLERTKPQSLGPGDKQPLQAWVGCSARLWSGRLWNLAGKQPRKVPRQ